MAILLIALLPVEDELAQLREQLPRLRRTIDDQE